MSWHTCYVKGWSLRCSPGEGSPRGCIVTLYVRSEREQWCLLCSLLDFSHFPLYPQSNWALLVLLPGWVGLCTLWAPVGLSNELSCEAGSFSCHLNRHRFFQPEVLRLYFPVLEPWVSWSVLFPICSSQFICTQMWDRPVSQLPSGWESSLPKGPSPPLLLVWIIVSSLTPWLSDFHTVRFSVSSGWFLFLNCCCPSFGCARSHSVSTYASILARFPFNFADVFFSCAEVFI